jgi:hypothetical protein
LFTSPVSNQDGIALVEQSNIKLTLVYDQVQGLARHTCATFQSREEFIKFHEDISQPHQWHAELFPLVDAQQGWQSTFAMFERALLLRSVTFLLFII